MYSTAYVSTADWNDTRFKRQDFDKMLLTARAELDQAKRKSIYRDMAVMVRDEGGLIVPLFNEFIDAHRRQGRRLGQGSHQELMDGYALAEVLAERLIPTSTGLGRGCGRAPPFEEDAPSRQHRQPALA